MNFFFCLWFDGLWFNELFLFVISFDGLWSQAFRCDLMTCFCLSFDVFVCDLMTCFYLWFGDLIVLCHLIWWLVIQQPPWSRLLVPGVFKPSCSTPFTPFLRLVSVYWPFQLYFIPKTLHNTSVFSSLLTSYFYLTGHSPVFIYNTTLLHILLLTLCGHLQTQCVCHALHPVWGGGGEDGILVAEVPRGVQHTSLAQTSPRRVVGLAPPNQSAGCALP